MVKSIGELVTQLGRTNLGYQGPPLPEQYIEKTYPASYTKLKDDYIFLLNEFIPPEGNLDSSLADSILLSNWQTNPTYSPQQKAALKDFTDVSRDVITFEKLKQGPYKTQPGKKEANIGVFIMIGAAALLVLFAINTK